MDEVFTGTVIQPLPDNVAFTQLGQFGSKYPIRSSPNDAAGQIGQLVFGGGRFIADQLSGSYYRIPLPGASVTWGWAKTDNRMVVYPQLTNPALNLSILPNHNFPIQELFATATNKAMLGRLKFNRAVVQAFRFGSAVLRSDFAHRFGPLHPALRIVRQRGSAVSAHLAGACVHRQARLSASYYQRAH